MRHIGAQTAGCKVIMIFDKKFPNCSCGLLTLSLIIHAKVSLFRSSSGSTPSVRPSGCPFVRLFVRSFVRSSVRPHNFWGARFV